MDIKDAEKLLYYAPAFFTKDGNLNVKFMEEHEGCFDLQEMLDMIESNNFLPVFELLIHVMYREIKFRETVFNTIIEEKNKTLDNFFIKIFVEEILFKHGVII